MLNCVKAANTFGYLFEKFRLDNKTSSLTDSLFKTIPSVFGKDNNDIRNEVLSNFDINPKQIRPYRRVIGGGRPKVGKEFHSPANVQKIIEILCTTPILTDDGCVKLTKPLLQYLCSRFR